jgi:hypothetical protein
MKKKFSGKMKKKLKCQTGGWQKPRCSEGTIENNPALKRLSLPGSSFDLV